MFVRFGVCVFVCWHDTRSNFVNFGKNTSQTYDINTELRAIHEKRGFLVFGPIRVL